MRKNLLNFVLAFLLGSVSLCAMAGDWTPPVKPTSAKPVSGDTVKLYNVNADLYVTSGKISAMWSSSAILAESGLDFRLDAIQGDSIWTITTASGGYAGKYLFTPTAASDSPHLFCDMAGTWQGGYKWKVEELPSGNYTLALFDRSDLEIEGTYMGADGMTLDVYYNIDPVENEEAQIEWGFVTSDLMETYSTRCALYEALYEAEDFGVNTASAGAVYNNADATLAELKSALNELKSAMASSIFDPDASEDNPQDISELLVNPTFDEDNEGWEKINDMTWIGSSYSGTNSEINCFNEKWTWDPSLTKEYGIYQIVNLPKGHYRLEVDALATRQSDQSVTVSGVKVYAKAENEYSSAVATANNSPQHYIIDFLIDGSTATEIGFHCDASTEANWICCDNFVLYYLGQSDVSQSYFRLSNQYNASQAKYNEDEIAYIHAQGSVIDVYNEAATAAQAALEARTSTDEEYDALCETLAGATASLNESVKLYDSLYNLANKISSLGDEIMDYNDDLYPEIDALNTLVVENYEYMEWGPEEVANAQAQYQKYRSLFDLILYCYEQTLTQEDGELIGMIEERMAQLETDWHSEKFQTADDVAAEKESIKTMIQDYLNSMLQPGDNITNMLADPNFDNKADGWTIESGEVKFADNVAEVYQNTFNIYQTLKNMPKGRYTLTCQSFQRTGWGLSGYDEEGTNVTSYIYGNNAQKKVHHVGAFCTENGYYTDGTDYPYDSHDDAMGYYPNSTMGAYMAFTSEDAPYVNTLDIFLTDAPRMDLTIGIRGGSTSSGWWTLFDNFTLVYQGNNASDYEEAILALIEELNTTVEDKSVTIDLLDTIEKVTEAANKAIDDNDADACIASIKDLQNAITEAKEVVAATDDLMENYSVICDYRMETVVSSDTSFDELLTQIATDCSTNNYQNLEEVAKAKNDLFTGFTKYVQFDGLTSATEEEPFDITPVIYNSDGVDIISGEYSTNGWTVEGSAAANENGTEFYNQNFSMSQTIYGLAPGYYKLRVQAYYRPGWPGQNLEGGANNAFLFAGDSITCMRYIYEDMQEDEYTTEMSEISDSLGNVLGYVPNSMSSGGVAFASDYYWNTLIFHVDEGQTETVIGMRKPETLAGDWVMFDNWTLEFVGSAKPIEESTAIEAVEEGNKNIRIFTTNGIEVNKPVKGVNIIKRTDRSGNIKVSKILVK